MKDLFEIARGQADAVEVYRVRRRSNPVNFYNYRALDVLHREHDEVSLRILRHGRLGVAKGSALDDAQQMVDDAVRAAAFGPELALPFPGLAAERGSEAVYDPALAELSVEQMIDDGRAIYEAARRRSPDMMLNLYLDAQLKEVSIRNTAGLDASYTTTIYTVCLLSMYPGSKEGINKEITGCQYLTCPPALIDELCTENELALKSCTVPTRRLPVVFRSSAMWSLMYRLLEGTSGTNVARGVTPLKDRVGQAIFGPNITVVDDPTLAGAMGSVPFDDEGVPTRRKVIVDRGVLRGFIFDLDSGLRTGHGSTGNGFKVSMWTRGVEIAPNPRYTNMVIQPGDWDLARMVADMDEGILVNDVIGFHSGNMLQGQYSMNVGVGFYVKGGRVIGRAVDTMVAGNVYEDFHRVKALGSELGYSPIVYSPDLYFSGLSVSGTA